MNLAVGVRPVQSIIFRAALILAYASCIREQLPEKASPPRTASVRVYPLAISEGIVFVWMGNDPWGKGALDILPVPSTVDNLDENKVRRWSSFVLDERRSIAIHRVSGTCPRSKRKRERLVL